MTRMFMMIVVLHCISVKGQLLTLYGSSDVAVVGKYFTLVCDASLPSSVGPIIYLKNGTQLCDLFFHENDCKSLDNGSYVPCRPDTCYCDDHGLYKWTIPNITDAWHLSKITCKSVYGYTSNELEIYVAVPVADISIEPTFIQVINNETIELVCKTSKSRPAAKITWSRKTKHSQTYDNITTGISHDYSHSISILKYVVSEEDNGAIFICHVSSEMFGTEIRALTKQITVFYGAENSMKLMPTRRMLRITQSESLDFNCFADCNPKCTIHWHLPNGTEVESNKLTISHLAVKETGRYICQASNVIGENTHVTEKYINVIVANVTDHDQDHNGTPVCNSETILKIVVTVKLVEGLVLAVVVITILLKTWKGKRAKARFQSTAMINESNELGTEPVDLDNSQQRTTLFQ